MTAPRRVLVTGAGGFIGRSSLAPLSEAGFEVHGVLSPGGLRGARAGERVHRAARHACPASFIGPICWTPARSIR